MMEIKRDRYLKQLIESRQNGFIKVVTGIRRCGKSYLLNVLFYHYLLDNGVADDHIIRIDLEDRMNKELRNPDTMLHYVHDRIKDKELYYIIIDEVQLMDEFVDVLNSFRHIDNADTYVTGSNSHFLSSDIPTEFRGRGETIHVNPLSFAEFYSAVGGDKQDAWSEYYTYGGLPLIQSFETEEKKINYPVGYKRKKITEEDIEKIKGYLEKNEDGKYTRKKGVTCALIAKELHFTEMTVEKYIRVINDRENDCE